jgi:transcriptional regulator with PAS, ATPase and Fis domain
MEQVKLNVEVWKNVFASSLFRQTSILFQQIFKRNILFCDLEAMGITREEWLGLRRPPEFIPFPFCELIFKTEEGKRRCLEETKQVLDRIPSTFKTEIWTCYTGLTEVVIPIIIHNKYYGSVSTRTGILLNEPNETEWQHIAERVKDTGVDLELLKKEYLEITPISKELFEVMLKFLNVLVEEIVKTAIETEEHKKRVAELEKALYAKYQFTNIVGQSKAMRKVYDLLDKAISSNYPVVIYGETGTGKELVARALHFNDQRKDKPFVSENCAAFASGVLESELFGHIKGAFTGADKDKKGVFELADGGTLFLDEVSMMDQEMQKKLLRVLQEYEIRPVGGKETIKVDVRIIAATNQDLKKLVEKGKFREDLYYRLNVININLPPLRERQEDIPLLVNHFLDKIAQDTKTKKKTLSEEAMRIFLDYHWPGNVRELENEIKRICTLTSVPEADPLRRGRPASGGGEAELIDAQMVSPHLIQLLKEPLIQPVGKSFSNKSFQEVMDETEREFIRQAFQKANNNKSICAKNLGLSRVGLMKKMKRLGLE